MGLVLDTNVLVAPQRGGFDLRKVLASYGDIEVGMSAVTAAELLRGAGAARDPIRSQRRAYVETLLEFVPVLPFGVGEAREYARLAAQLSYLETPLGPHELMVAATAISLGWALLTLHTGDYEIIDGLVLAPRVLANSVPQATMPLE